jgi:phage gpG-like protein
VKLTLRFNAAGAEHKIETIVRSLDDLKPALNAWNKYKRKEVQERFAASGPGWSPTLRQQSTKTSQASEERARQISDALLRRKLKRQLRRAQQQHTKGKGTAASVERRYMILKEFERLAAGGAPSLSLITDDAKLAKNVAGMRGRQQRALTKASSKTLGRIASSIKSKLSKHEITIYSEIEWSGAHNKGARVGHGTTLPERRFLEVTEDDMQLLKKLIEEHVASSGE